ncbi:hypothetical protein [Kitasatospora sp. NPDC051164]|uniref:hypothetical protein n=1 Tax=Kitasatospora sp. NPDC051164 TaxID=3364055 RepID=UPI003789E955
MSQGASDIKGNIFGAGDKVYYADNSELKLGEVVGVSVDGEITISSEYANGLVKRDEKQVHVA